MRRKKAEQIAEDIKTVKLIGALRNDRYTYREIAELLGTNIYTAHSKFKRASKRLGNQSIGGEQ